MRSTCLCKHKCFIGYANTSLTQFHVWHVWSINNTHNFRNQLFALYCKSNRALPQNKKKTRTRNKTRWAHWAHDGFSLWPMSMNHAYKASPKRVRSAVARLDSPVMSRLIKEQNKNNNNKTNKRLTATTVNETSVSCASGTLPFLGRIGLTFTFCTIAETSWALLYLSLLLSASLPLSSPLSLSVSFAISLSNVANACCTTFAALCRWWHSMSPAAYVTQTRSTHEAQKERDRGRRRRMRLLVEAVVERIVWMASWKHN